MQRDLGVLGSSEDATKLGDTVKGIIILLSTVLIALAGHYGIDIVQAEIVEFATVMGGAIGALWTAYGLIKKVLVKTIA